MTIAPAGRPDPRRLEPLWTRVDSNRIRLAGYVALFVVSAVVTADVMLLTFGGCGFLFIAARLRAYETAGWALGNAGLVATWVSAVFGIGALSWALFAINRSERWLVRRLGARFVERGDLLPTKMALKDMAIAGGLPVAPALYVLDASAVNAFVFSARGRRPIVGVTSGLTTKLTPTEQRAVFANLVARIVSGDTIADTGVAALMLPLNAYRSRSLATENRAMDAALLGGDDVASMGMAMGAGSSGAGFLLLFAFGFSMAIVGAVFTAFQRHRQLRAAEKADAEGMLLLKDPPAMLSALEKCVVLNNTVSAGAETFSDLFYCWPGSSTNDEDDPEWERVARLREVLGVEGMVEQEAPVRDGLLPPPPPRLDEAPAQGRPVR